MTAKPLRRIADPIAIRAIERVCRYGALLPGRPIILLNMIQSTDVMRCPIVPEILGKEHLKVRNVSIRICYP